VQEVGGAVQRVDDPDELAVLRAVHAAGLFGQDAVARVGAEQDLDDRGFRRVVDLAREVVRPLVRDLQDVQVLRTPVDDRPGSTSGLDGDVEHGVQRLRHDVS